MHGQAEVYLLQVQKTKLHFKTWHPTATADGGEYF